MSTNGIHKSSLFVALILVTLLLSPGAGLASSQSPGRVKVLIAFSQQPGPAETALVRAFGGDIKYTYHLVPAIAASLPEAAIDALLRNPNVTAIEPDLEVQVVDAELDNTWGVKRIGAGAVHVAGNRGAGIKVAVLDTGIDTDHPDLNYDPSCSASFVASEPTLEDGHGHGTHTAGTVAALDNEAGVVGAAPEVTLCIYKVFDSFGNSKYSDIAAAIERAVDDGVQVTNNSYGGSGDPGSTIQAVFDNAYTAGVLHIAAAGNSGNFFGTGENCIYPARWASVMATAATTQSDTRASFSSTCPEVEIAAPGSLIYSTMPGGGYGYKNGTSMASPHAAGTAALVLATHPGWSNEQVRAQLQATADDLGNPGRDPWYGYGLVDAVEAAGGLPPNTPPVADDQNVITDEDTSVAITLTGSDADGDPLTYNVITGPANGALSGTPPNLTYTPGTNYHGPDSFTFKVNDGMADSNVANVSITVNPVNNPPSADDQAVNTAEDTPVAITLTAVDVDGDPLTYSVVSGPANGTLSGAAPNLTYTPDPNYHGSDSFTFVADDGLADSNVATVSITVTPANDPPLAAFTYTCADLTCNFDASASSDPDGTIAGYSWDFGDGQAGSGATAGHSYAAAGSYDVILTVTDDGNATGSDTQTVTVSDAPSSMHVGDLDGSLASTNRNFWWAEVTITLHDQAEGPVASATVQGTWSGGASGSGSCLTAGAGTCTILSPKIALAQPTITFTVDDVVHASMPYDPAGNHDPDGDTAGTSIVVSQSGNQPPLASFTYNCPELSCSFDASGSSDPDGSIVSYEWNFGDGNTGSGVTASHAYAAAGTYAVLLTATDDDNATDTESQNVPVGVSPGTMFIYAITMSGKAAGPNRSATVVVTIHDTNNNPVAGATVYGTWSGDTSASVSGVTAADGTVTFISEKVRQANATFTFTVDDVLRDGFTYDPGLNNQSSVTLVVP